MARAGSAVWIDVLPALNKLGPGMVKGAVAGAKTAGAAAGKQFSAAMAAGAQGGGGATAMVQELQKASKIATRTIQQEKTAIYQARTSEKAAAQGVQAAEARLAQARLQDQAVASKVAQSEAALAAARQKHGAEAAATMRAEQALLRAQAGAQASVATTVKAEQALTVARGKVGVASDRTAIVEEKLKEAFKANTIVSTQLGNAQSAAAREMKVTSGAMAEQAKLGAPLAAGLSRAGGGLKTIAAGAISTVAPLGQMAAGFGAIVGIGKVITLGNEYTRSMNELGAVTASSAAEMQRAGVVSRSLGSDLTLPATSGADAAAIMVELAKGGLSLQGSMDAAKGTIQLAAAAQIDGARAAEIQANSLNQFGLAAKDAGMVADVLANTANAAAGGVDDIGLSLKYVGPVARSLGIDIKDTASSIGLLANQGLKGDTAGTALRGMLASLARPSKAAQKGVDALGLSVFDSQGKFVGMRAVVESLSKAQKEMTQEQFAANAVLAFGREPLAAVTALASEGTKGFDGMSKSVGRAGGAAAVANSQMQGLGGAMDKLGSQLEDVALGIYTTVSPALEAAANGIASSLDGAGGKVQSFLDVAGGLGKLAFTGKGMAAPAISGIDPAVVAGILTARDMIVSAYGDISRFATQSLIPSLKNIAVAVGPLAAILGGVFLAGLRSVAAILANVVGPALVATTGFLRDHQGVVIAAAAVIGYLVLAYKAQQAQLAILEAGGLAKYIAQTKLGVFWDKVAAAGMVTKKLAIMGANGALKVAAGLQFTLVAATKGWTTALALQRGTALLATTSTVALTGAQTAYNAALLANPIGLVIVAIVAIIAAIAALVAGVIWAYKNLDWFRTAVDAVWTGIKVGVKAVGDAAVWLWQNVFAPAFQGIAQIVQWTWNSILFPIFDLIGAIIRNTLGAAFVWFRDSVVKPVWSWITSQFQSSWAVWQYIFGAVGDFLRRTLGPSFTWLHDSVIKPVFEGIGKSVSWQWNNVLKPVFQTLGDFATKTIPAAFDTMQKGVAKAWDAVKDAAKAPIRFVVNTVVNDALIGNFNKLADAFGTKKMKTISLPKGFSSGGIIPGYQSAKRDEVLTPMRKGEGVLVPEVIRALGTGFVHNLNAAGNAGGVTAVRKVAGYAKGGVVGKNDSGADGGGVGGVLAGAWKWTKDAAASALDVLSDPMGTLGNLVKAVIGKIPGAGQMVDLAAGFGRKILDGAVSMLKNFGIGDTGGSGANGQIPRASLAKASGFTGGSGVGPLGGYLKLPAARAWQMAYQASGGGLTLTEGYRSLQDQQMRYAAYRAGRGNLAATPGTSVHGFGLAADVGAGQAWLRANGARFGWYPTGLSFAQREPWHFEYKGASKGMANGGVVGMQPQLMDRGGVLPSGPSLVVNKLRKPEYALPEDRLVDVVAKATEENGGGDGRLWRDLHVHTDGGDTDKAVRGFTRAGRAIKRGGPV